MIVTPDASVLLKWVLPGNDESDTAAALAVNRIPETSKSPARPPNRLRLPVQLVEMQEDGPVRRRVQDPGGPAEGERSLPGPLVPVFARVTHSLLGPMNFRREVVAQYDPDD